MSRPDDPFEYEAHQRAVWRYHNEPEFKAVTDIICSCYRAFHSIDFEDIGLAGCLAWTQIMADLNPPYPYRPDTIPGIDTSDDTPAS